MNLSFNDGRVLRPPHNSQRAIHDMRESILTVTDTHEPQGFSVLRVRGAQRRDVHQMAVRVLETLHPWQRTHPFPLLTAEPDGQWLATVHYLGDQE